MSGAIWNGNLPGMMMNRTRAYVWNTSTQAAISGKESRIRLMQYPRVAFTLQYELLRDNLPVSELRTVLGIFNLMGGMFDTFLYADPEFNSVTAQIFGVGDGVTKAFQLTANFQGGAGYSAPEIIQNLNGAPVIKIGAVKTLAYTLGPTGVVTFAAAPPLGAVLSWSGSFYYRVRFDSDTLEMTQFVARWWQSESIALLSVKL